MVSVTQAEVDALKDSGEFDADWYLATYEDVAMLGMDPAKHYLMFGKSLGRSARQEVGSSARKRQIAFESRVAEDSLDLDFEGFTNKEWRNYARRDWVGAILKKTDLPLVTVVMTSYNAEDTIERAILSMLNQDYPNLEVVVCDDCSTDRTWQRVLALQKQSGGSVRSFRVAQNSGSYLCKNIAVEQAKGEIILFQGADGYSHPARVSCQVAPLLDDADLIATGSRYILFDPITRKIIFTGGVSAKLGLITLAVRSAAFTSIGYFDAVRKAGDDEWYRRLQHLYGGENVKNLAISLYCAELRSGSLIADMGTDDPDGSIEQVSSAERRTYVDIFTKRFSDKTKKRSWYQENFVVSPVRPVAIYPLSIQVLPKMDSPVIGALCSKPSRIAALRNDVSRILPQLDELHVFLDKYDSVPDFLHHQKITVSVSSSFALDMRDNAKFLSFTQMKEKFNRGFYYFTFDDDILYPHDYVRHLVAGIEKFSRKCAVGVHGVVVGESGEGYFENRFTYHFSRDAVYQEKFVNNLGTGTLAFWSDCFDTLDPAHWGEGGMELLCY